MFNTVTQLVNWPQVVITLLLGAVLLFVVRLIQHRRFYADLPKPPHTLLLGNASFFGEAMKRFPADAHPQALFAQLAKEFDFPGLYYLDLFPFARSMVICTDAHVVAQTDSIRRDPWALTFMRGLVGTKSLFSTTGQEWKDQRNWFLPAFSLSNITALVPEIVEEVLLFKAKLTKFAASGETFSMGDAVIPLTIDVIARSTIGTRLQSQTHDSPIQQAFQGALDWTAPMNAGLMKRILSPFMMDMYTRRLDKLLLPLIKEKCLSNETSKAKSIIDLALHGYMKETGKLGDSSKVDEDSAFMQIALDNAKLFLLGGHDTTASLVAYTYYLLTTHPELLERVRQEHEEVFGTGFETTQAALLEDPHLLNKIVLTSAVFKEVLRLYPAGSNIKRAAPGITLEARGRKYPVDNHMILIVSTAVQRDARYWPEPEKFDPDRFMAPNTYDPKNWIAFSRGPQNCIGQQLALIEAKVIMALTLRFFDFLPQVKPDGPSIPGYGGRVYQEMTLTAKPKDGIPTQVKLRNG